MIKQMESSIKVPLLIIFQHSFLEHVVPTAWKHAKVFPLYKAKGDATVLACTDPLAYAHASANF